MNDNRSMKLLIVDDHPVVREGLAALLRQAGPDTAVLLAEDTLRASAWRKLIRISTR